MKLLLLSALTITLVSFMSSNARAAHPTNEFLDDFRGILHSISHFEDKQAAQPARHASKHHYNDHISKHRYRHLRQEHRQYHHRLSHRYFSPKPYRHHKNRHH